jgi:hypothetical protein
MMMRPLQERTAIKTATENCTNNECFADPASNETQTKHGNVRESRIPPGFMSVYED